MAGYSGTPLARKLGIKEGTRLWAKNAPRGYRRLLAPLPPDVTILSRAGKDLDLIHLFTLTRRELAKSLRPMMTCIRQDGAIWVSWPKKSAKVPTDVTEDVVRELALPLGLVDIKVCAVDETWSGLKLVIRREHRRK
jgi:hypothetical protein